jgi:hypothetical protein
MHNGSDHSRNRVKGVENHYDIELKDEVLNLYKINLIITIHTLDLTIAGTFR